ncbi:ComF family protein [Silanimonas algicola]
MPAPFAAVWHAIEAWALPVACLGCEAPADPETLLCRPCRALFRPAPTTPLPAISAHGGTVHAAFTYDAACAPLLTRYKFHDDLAAGRALAALALPALAGATRPDALVPVPLHRRRLRQRGHDQALGLARDWGRALRLPVLVGALRRERDTRPQTQLDAAQRRRNLAAAFSMRAPSPRHVALVDDVLTTGSTARAAAEALQEAGAMRVDVWAVARVRTGPLSGRG